MADLDEGRNGGCSKVKLLYHHGEIPADNGRTQHFLTVYDREAPDAAPCGWSWITHPVSLQSSSKVYAKVLDILSAAAGQKFDSLADASKHIAELWRGKELDKPQA